MPKSVEISRRTIFFILVLGIALWFIYQIRDILFLLFVSVILMSALNPFVDKLERLRIPRGLSIIIIYIFLWGIIGTLVASLIPPLVDQSGRLLGLLPFSLSRIDFFNTHQQEITREVLTRLGALPEGLIKFSVSLFGNLLGVLTISVVTFYLLLERKYLNQYVTFFLGPDHPEKSVRIINLIEQRLGGWVRGEVVLMLAVGTMTYVGLLILGIDIALPLAVLAGILEIVPNIGPTISAVPAILIGLTINPLIALATFALYFLVQQLENNLLVPSIMKKAVGVDPLISILALMIGFKISGAAGAVLAIPLLLVIQIIVTEAFPHRFAKKPGDE